MTSPASERVVKWVGRSEHWRPPPEPRQPWYAMPLTEDDVLPVAFGPDVACKLPRHAAVNCTSRLALRVALAHTGLNPGWEPVPWGTGDRVVKAPASALSSGVRRIRENGETRLLRKYAPELADHGVIEEAVHGPQYEQDGFVLDGFVRYFHPLLQHWDAAGERIVRYERLNPNDWAGEFQYGLRAAVAVAVRAAGLDNCPFCCELRWQHHRGWKVIELNARLGEDAGLAALMWDADPLAEIEKEAARGL